MWNIHLVSLLVWNIKFISILVCYIKFISLLVQNIVSLLGQNIKLYPFGAEHEIYIPFGALHKIYIPFVAEHKIYIPFGVEQNFYPFCCRAKFISLLMWNIKYIFILVQTKFKTIVNELLQFQKF